MTAKEQISQLIGDASPDTKKAIAAIFRIEKEHAYHARPVRVKEQVLEAIREAVK
jgi:spore maturation protein CgeB